MAQFPQTENDILALGRKVAAGLRDNPKVFPKPVVKPDQLDATHEKFRQAIKQANAARVAAKKATKRKKEVLKQYKAELSDALRYAESVTSSDSRKLGLIGWGARRAAKQSPPPGQVPDSQRMPTESQPGRSSIQLATRMKTNMPKIRGR